MKHRTARLPQLLRLLPLACLCACASASLGGAPEAAAIELRGGPVFEAIARLEEARSSGDGELERLLEHPEAAVRARAATALGRIPVARAGAGATRALHAALGDDQPQVQAAAAFALGQRGDPASAEPLLELAFGPGSAGASPQVRARALEAATKLARPDLRARMLAGLSDPEPAVRLEAAAGPQRWPREEAGAGDVDRELVAALGRERDPRVAMYALAALERRKAPAALDAFRLHARAPRPDQRIFAVRGLRQLAPAPDTLRPLIAASRDEDWRVVCEALSGLGAHGGPEAVRALGEGTRHRSPHARRCAWESVAALSDRLEGAADLRALREALQPWWLDQDAFRAEPSASVRAAFVEAELPLLARLRAAEDGWTPEQAAAMPAQLESTLEREPPVVLAGLARALGRIEQPWARDFLARLARGSPPWVASAAVEALGRHPGDATRLVLHELLLGPDNGLRLGAVVALQGWATEADLPGLERAYATSRGEIGPEVRFNALRAAARVGGEDALALLRRGLEDADPFVRSVAAAELERLGAPLPGARARPPDAAELPQVPMPGRDFPAWERNPRVALRTSRGTLVLELFPAEAPLHVHSFLGLARRGHYDGLIFHRVVPDFVVQGGDPRGDGNGGSDWRGGSLRQEIGPRKFVRGSLGMPRNDDLESGGCQIFLTHRPTPHLDGRYTVFGELRGGGEVLDALEVGDRIESVQEIP